jgi:hypothetical protein
MVIAGSNVERKRRVRLFIIAFIAVLVLAVGLLVGLLVVTFGPYVALALPVLAFFVAYLWLYIGLAAAAVIFAAAWLILWRRRATSRRRLQFASLAAAIAFALTGLVLIVSTVLLRYDPHLVGYRLHTRIWLDAETVRSWAQDLEITDAAGHQEWPLRRPLTLWLTGLPFGRVCVHTETRDVTVDQGGALSGHWGVFVTADGREWNGEHPFLEDMRRLKVEDGVWVWYTED